MIMVFTYEYTYQEREYTLWMLSAPAVHSACNQTLYIRILLLQTPSMLALCRSEHMHL